MSFAIYAQRNDKSMQPIGFVPHWVADLRLSERYGAAAVGIDFSKYLWWRRALILAEADNRSYAFETKK